MPGATPRVGNETWDGVLFSSEPLVNADDVELVNVALSISCVH